MKWSLKHVMFSLLFSLLVSSEGRKVRAEETVHNDIAKLHNELFGSNELPSFAWTGAYIGVNLGAGIPIHLNERLQAVQGSNPSQFDLMPPTAERVGVASGIQAGYNWQIGNFVYGVETDINFQHNFNAVLGWRNHLSLLLVIAAGAMVNQPRHMLNYLAAETRHQH